MNSPTSIFSITKNMLPYAIKPRGLTWGFILLFVLFCQLATAQLYPVQANPNLVPPYSLKLSDYATTTSEKLQLMLLMTDVNEANLQVRLRMSIEGDRVSVRSTDFVQGATPIRLIGGVPTRLSNLDLRPYFDLRNLQGISPRQYNTPLPDGLYQFCFEVFDFVTGRQLSQKRCIPVYLVLNDPPFLNLPQRGEQIGATNPQNLIFQWTPRHLNATGVQYEFQLRELWDGGIDPQAAFLASPDLYTTTTFATTLHYGPGETTLLEGKTYGWRVRAIVGDGISETSVFRNNGFSEIFNFVYTGKCDVPKFILAKSEGTTTETISWQTNPNHLQYQVQYRKPGKSGAVWFEAETTGTTKTLIFLEPATTYEFRVGGQCMPDGGYSFSAVNTFTTPTREEASNYNCGIPPEILITNQDPLEALNPGDKFTAGDFPVKVVEVSGGNGTFSGKGFIEVPYLALIKIAVVFNNININTDGQMTDGTVETAYDADFATGTNAGSMSIAGAVDKVKQAANDAMDEFNEILGNDEKEQDTASSKANENGVGSAADTKVASSPERVTETQNEVATASNSDMAATGGPNPANDTDTVADSGADTDMGETSTDTEPETESPENAVDVAIEYNGQYYKNGDVIELAYDRNMEKQAFELKNAPENANISWSTYADMIEASAYSSAGDGQRTILDIRDYENRALEAEWKAVDSSQDQSEKIRVQINVVKKNFVLKEIYATHKKKRVATSGQTLYILDDTGITENSKYKDVAFSAVFDEKLAKADISETNLGWYYGLNSTVPNDKGEINILRNIRLPEGYFNTTVKAGFPATTEKSIQVERFTRDYRKYKLSYDSESNPFIKKLLKATEMTEGASKFFDKIPFIKKVKDKQNMAFNDGGINWFFEIIPFERTTENKEFEDSPLYYTEKSFKGGFEAGLQGKVNIWTWGVPWDKTPMPDWAIKKAKAVITAEINIVASADVRGSLIGEMVERKTVGSDEWELIRNGVNPASLSLNAAFGVEGELSAFKDNEWFSFSATASGLAKAELLSLGWYGNEFKREYLREGVWMDFNADLYVIVGGFKLETSPFYKRVQLIEPFRDED